jgi:hypothetical protein
LLANVSKAWLKKHPARPASLLLADDKPGRFSRPVALTFRYQSPATLPHLPRRLNFINCGFHIDRRDVQRRLAMRTQYQLTIKAEGIPGPVRQQTYDEEQRVDVRELCMHVMTRIRIQEISLYRHTLFIDGQAYSILSVVRQH